MLLCVWPALNPLSVHVTFTAIVPGTYSTQGRLKCALGWLQKLTHVPLVIAILLVSCWSLFAPAANNKNGVRVNIVSINWLMVSFWSHVNKTSFDWLIDATADRQGKCSTASCLWTSQRRRPTVLRTALRRRHWIPTGEMMMMLVEKI